MKIKIDHSGYLRIERAQEWRKMGCPYSDGEGVCGDWCALFGEPETETFVNEDGKNESETYLRLCRCTLYGEIIDER